MMNSSYVNMLRSIPRASGLQIECGLFLWLSSDVGNLLQVFDVPCMGCGELKLVHGENHHERAMELNGMLAWVEGRMGEGLGLAHHVVGELYL
jgi:hypothetical protein